MKKILNFDYSEAEPRRILLIKLPIGLFWLQDDIHNPFPIGEKLFNTLQVDNKKLYIFDNICVPDFLISVLKE